MGFCTFLKHLEVNSRVCPKIFSFLISQVPVLSSVQEKDIYRRKHHTLVCFRTCSDNCNRMFVFLCIHKGLVSNGFSCCETQVLTLIAFIDVALSWFKGNLHTEANCKVSCNTSYLWLRLFLSDDAESWSCTVITLLAMKSQLLWFNKNDGLQFKTLQNVEVETHKRQCVTFKAVPLQRFSLL